VVPHIDWIECLLLAAASASPWRNWRPRRDLLPRVLVCNLRPAAHCSFRRLPLPYSSKRPASALAVPPLLLPWLPLLPASVTLLLLSVPVQLPLPAASLRLAASLWRLFFSSSSPLAAKAASFWKRKKEEVLRAIVCRFPLAIKKGGGGGVCVLGCKSGCLVPEEEGG
jgi:hypothetical protein